MKCSEKSEAQQGGGGWNSQAIGASGYEVGLGRGRLRTNENASALVSTTTRKRQAGEREVNGRFVSAWRLDALWDIPGSERNCKAGGCCWGLPTGLGVGVVQRPPTKGFGRSWRCPRADAGWVVARCSGLVEDVGAVVICDDTKAGVEGEAQVIS